MVLPLYHGWSTKPHIWENLHIEDFSENRSVLFPSELEIPDYPLFRHSIGVPISSGLNLRDWFRSLAKLNWFRILSVIQLPCNPAGDCKSFFCLLWRNKGELNRILIYGCRCDERLRVKPEGSARLIYTGLSGGLEHLKIETRLRGERFQSVKGECVI